MSVNVASSEWRLQTAGGIPYKVVKRSGEFTEEDSRGHEEYIIKAVDLSDFLLETFPVPFIATGGLVYPRSRSMPGLNVLACRRFSWEALTDGRPCDPFGADPGAPENTYDDNLKLTLDYSTTPGNDADADPNDPATFLEISGSASGTHIAMPMRSFSKWMLEPDGDPSDPSDDRETARELNIPLSFIEPSVEWSIRWTQIPFEFLNTVLMARLRSKIGTVNSVPMPLIYNAPVETILFLGYSYSQQFTWRSGTGGQPPAVLELKFLEKNFIDREGTQVHHNLLYRPGVGYRRLLVDGVHSMHAKTNLSQIFLPA